MKSDLEIARETPLRPIGDIAAKLDIPVDALEPYGRHKAKIGMDYIKSLDGRPEGARPPPRSVSVTRSIVSARVR
jgi:formate--tetrahydrofolate ligase